MKKKLLLIFFLILSINTFSQDKKYSIELNFPILIGTNFIDENYTGIIDLGFKYRLVKYSFLDSGFSLNGGLYNFNKNDNLNEPFKELYTIQPRIYAEINKWGKFRSSIGIGYSLLKYRTTQFDNGLNVSVGISYNITNDLFLQIRYDMLSKTKEYYLFRKYFYPIVVNGDNESLKIGIGLRL